MRQTLSLQTTESSPVTPPLRFVRSCRTVMGACSLGVLSLGVGLADGRDAPSFEDRRELAGIDFKHHANPTAMKYMLEVMGGGLAVFDYDNDGLLDIFFVNGGKFEKDPTTVMKIERSKPDFFNRLYRNNGTGAFTDVTEKAGLTGAGHGYGMGAATGDYDNDGDVDLYVTNFGMNVLYRNNGDGTFRDVTRQAAVGVGAWSASAGFFDYDNDGYLDLFVVQYLDWDFSKHISCGDVYCPPRYEPAVNFLFRNHGDGTFADVSARAGIAAVFGKGLGVAFHDYDGDGLTDVCVANDSVAQHMFHNEGDGTFSELALDLGLAYNEDGLPFSGMGIDFEDYDNDGLPDVVITNLAKELYALYRNDSGGTFTFVTRTSNIGSISAFMSGWGTHFIDYDHDGWKDLFVAQSHVIDNIERFDPAVPYRQPPLLARNLHNGKFADVSEQSGAVFSQPVVGRGAAFGDLDNDGDVDIVVGVLDDAPLLLYSNASELPNHWLEIQTVGTVSNRDGLGAVVKLVGSSGHEQWGYVTRAGSYLSANDARVHFGLGSDEVIASIEIRWPSGARQVLRNVESNQVFTVREPKTVGSE